MSQLLPLTGRVAIVTGANHGIGAASARRLGTLGADVLITYLRGTNRATGDIPAEYAHAGARDGSAVVSEIIEGGREAVAVEADLSDTARIPELFDRAETELGPVDIIVNNASGWTADTFLETRAALGIDRSSVIAATIDQVMAVDARAASVDDRRIQSPTDRTRWIMGTHHRPHFGRARRLSDGGELRGGEGRAGELHHVGSNRTSSIRGRAPWSGGHSRLILGVSRRC